MEDAARAAGISARTAYRRLNDAAIQDAIAAVQRRDRRRFAGELAAACGEALDVVRQELSSPDRRTRLQAAELLLEHRLRFVRLLIDDDEIAQLQALADEPTPEEESGPQEEAGR